MVLSVGTVKKAEHWRIDAFELSCWRRLLRVPWNVRRSNQSILREISLEYSLEGLMLKLKLQYLGHLMWRTDSLEKNLMLGKTEGRRRRGRQDKMVGWHHRLDGHELEQAPRIGDGEGGLACCSPWSYKESNTTKWLNWIELEVIIKHILIFYHFSCSNQWKIIIWNNSLINHSIKNLRVIEWLRTRQNLQCFSELGDAWLLKSRGYDLRAWASLSRFERHLYIEGETS